LPAARRYYPVFQMLRPGLMKGLNGPRPNLRLIWKKAGCLW
jgi:hypothetical protein